MKIEVGKKYKIKNDAAYVVIDKSNFNDYRTTYEGRVVFASFTFHGVWNSDGSHYRYDEDYRLLEAIEEEV